MQALVLSGGNIKGAFQAGAVATLLRAGYRPDIITGISVGALNGGFLVSRASRASLAGNLDWPVIGDLLTSFWRQRVTGPSALLSRRGAFDLGWRILTKQWDGLIDMSRLYQLVRETIVPADFENPPVRSAFGAVSLETGAISYQNAVDFIIASTQEPVSMPLYRIGDQSYYDGGLRELAPLKQAIALGATRIVCVACQPVDVGPLEKTFNRGDPLALVGRVLEIVTNELLNGDLETLLATNDLLARIGDSVSGLRDKRVIPLLVVRPTETIGVDITGFGPQDIERMIGLGTERMAARIREGAADPDDPGHPIATELAHPAPAATLRPAA